MKTIKRNHDDLIFRVQITDDDDNEYLLSDFDEFAVNVFTDDIDSAVNVDNTFIDSDNLIRIPANLLADLHDGIIRLQVMTALTDAFYPDGQLNESCVTDTCYFLK